MVKGLLFGFAWVAKELERRHQREHGADHEVPTIGSIG